MRRGGSPGEGHPAALFYDGLAADYDREQFCSPVSIVRKTEYALFEARLPSLFSPSDRVSRSAPAPASSPWRSLGVAGR